ncbi:MAG: NAD-dependent epimerase/dehydratase family protein, partial [Bacteroidota bacterium]|nr:NAD-dependent epimerase/dehydratase family protein [Bacteroidota bacterium]
MAHVLVTGATGFIGHYVVQQLLEQGHRVTASSRQEEKAATFPWFFRVVYKPLNLEQVDDQQDYFDYFGKPDHLIHLGWEGLPNYTSAVHTERNLPAQQLFLNNLLRHGLKDLTVTGTCFEYGMREGKLDESMPAA